MIRELSLEASCQDNTHKILDTQKTIHAEFLYSKYLVIYKRG